MLMGNLRSAGRLGECRLKTSAGNLRLQRTGPLRADTGAGHITADSVAGNAEIHTGTGKVRVGEVKGTLVVKNSNGDTEIEAVTGDLRVRSANGAISVEQAGAGVEVKTSNGTIRIGEVARGSVEIATAMGDLEIGIAEGTAAWLDLNTGFGEVRNLLDNATQAGEVRRDRRGARAHLLRRHHHPTSLRKPMSTKQSPAAIEVTGLRKSFGEHVVLDGIDLTPRKGRSFRCSAQTAPGRPPPSRSCPP